MAGGAPRLGGLERRVMAVLWAADDPLSTADVRATLAGDPAYTTVATVLGHLVDKGLAERHRDGRAWRFTACAACGEYAARAVTDALDLSRDRVEALAHLVAALPVDDRATLRRLLTAG